MLTPIVVANDVSKAMGLLRSSTVVAIAASGMILYRCYLPGRSDLMNLGLQLFLVAAIGWLFALFKLQKSDFSTSFCRKSGNASLIALPSLVLISALALTPLPQHIAFELSRPQLERLAINLSSRNQGPQLHYLQGLPMLSAGVFAFDTYATDDTGGVYFVTSYKRDKGVEKSTGFAFKPALSDQPIGRAGYLQTSLWSDWQTFSASD